MHVLHALRQPLAQKAALAVQHGDAAVAVAAFAVGHIDIAVLAIDEDAGRHVELRERGIERLALDGAVGGIQHALLADLHEQLAAVMGEFLHHAGRGGGDPEIAVLVEMAAVQARHRAAVGCSTN